MTLFVIAGKEFWAGHKSDGYYTNLFDGRWIKRTGYEEVVTEYIVRIFRKRTISNDMKRMAAERILRDNRSKFTECYVLDRMDRNGITFLPAGWTTTDPKENETKTTEATSAEEPDVMVIVKSALESLINFFTEFKFEPNFRFVNTFCWQLTSGKDEAKSYIRNYFKLTDNFDANSISEKIDSAEFDSICAQLKDVTPAKKINGRFKLYYGSAGTGKTTAMNDESFGNNVVCHSAMLPSDLMEDFAFDDGKAGFHKSALWIAMEEGKPIGFDEINLLPFESLRFLQGILDGKSEIVYKGQTVKIKDGFMVIGTMNLTVNGTTFALPEPLVDRACELKEFKLTADNLVSAII